MRFAAAHKLSTYLMVVTAYLALVLSGELSDVAVLLSFAGILGSWWWEPPRVRLERYTTAWTVLSALVLAWTVLSAFTGGDFLLVGAEFILYLVVAKLFNRRVCKDYQQVYILTFLMLVAGTVLNTEFTYGVFFLGYVVATTWALILFHLRREMEDNFLLKHSTDRTSERVQVARILNSRRIVGRRFFIGTSLVSLAVFFAATVLFLAIPRIGFGLFFNKSRSGVTMAGFSDGVKLGGHGVIKNDDTVVMRVHVPEEYEGRRAPYVHWRGVAFDEYEDGQWKRSREAPRTRRRIVHPDPSTEHHHLLYAGQGRDIEALEKRRHAAMRHEIYLEPIGYDVVFGASMPVTFEFESQLGRRSPRRERNDEIRFSHSAGIKYVVYSDVTPPDPEALREAPNAIPVGYDVYTDPVRDITDRTRQKAREITAGLTNNYDKAVALEQWLKTELDYTLQMEDPGDTEPIHFFLFERRKGHCEYFSSAMTVMAREVGLPARNVNGFLGGEWNEYDDYIAVRAGDAHSWVEIYFEGHGWVTFDPTPSAEVDRLGRGGDGIGDRLRRFIDTLRFKWFKWVIEYDLYRQIGLFKSIGRVFEGGSSRLKGTLKGAKAWLERHRRTVTGVLLGAIGVVVVFILWRRRRDAGTGPLGSKARRTRQPIARIYNQVLARMAKRGLRRDAAATPREFAAAMTRRAAPGAATLAELTELYYAAEYGARADAATVERAGELAAAIETALAEARKKGKTTQKSPEKRAD